MDCQAIDIAMEGASGGEMVVGQTPHLIDPKSHTAGVAKHAGWLKPTLGKSLVFFGLGD